MPSRGHRSAAVRCAAAPDQIERALQVGDRILADVEHAELVQELRRAMTVLESDAPSSGQPAPAGMSPAFSKPFGLMFEALDDLKEDEVYICSGASWSFALWGGLMSTRAKVLKAAGAVLDGYSSHYDAMSGTALLSAAEKRWMRFYRDIVESTPALAETIAAEVAAEAATVTVPTTTTTPMTMTMNNNNKRKHISNSRLNESKQKRKNNNGFKHGLQQQLQLETNKQTKRTCSCWLFVSLLLMVTVSRL